MSLTEHELHRQAMAFHDEARLLERRALEKYRAAAELEERYADVAGEQQRPRSRGILRISAVSLWIAAGDLDRGEELARRYLQEPLLPGYRGELRKLLGEIRRRRDAVFSTLGERARER